MTTAFIVTSAADLNAAVAAMDVGGGSAATNTAYTIVLAAASGTIDLGSDPTGINLSAGDTLTIVGGGQTIDGHGLNRGLFVYAGNVVVQNLTIAHARAKGGDGAGVAGGGAGLGGGLFVAAQGTVSLSGVTFAGDQAIGGSGGQFQSINNPDRAGRGGGGGLGGNGGAGWNGAGGGGGGIGGGATGGGWVYGGATLLAPGSGVVPGAPSGATGTVYFSQPGPANPGGFAGGGGGAGGSAAAAIPIGDGGRGGGGFGGGGGGGGISPGGNGGFGGGGGGNGGNGGFGGGGGGAGGVGQGVPGFGGGAPFDAGYQTKTATHFNYGGGGGLGAGGAIFVQQGGSLTLLSGAIGGGAVAGGAFGGLGAGIFLQGNQAITLAPAAGQTLTIANAIADQHGSDPSYAEAGTLDIGGSGITALTAINTYSGGTTIDGGTLELGGANAAGTGAISFSPKPGRLIIDGAFPPANRIFGFQPGDTIDLPGLTATGAASIDTGGTLSIPTTSGTVTLALDPRMAFGAGGFPLAPDGHGGTFMTTSIPPVVAVVTVTGAASDVFTVPFDTAEYAGTAQVYANQQSTDIATGTAIPFVFAGGAAPTVAAGKNLVLYDPAGLPVVLPDTVPAALFTNAAGRTSITSGATSGDLIVSGQGGIDFTAGVGLFNLFAGSGDNNVSLAAGVGGGFMTLGNGNNTVNAIGGNNYIYTGTGTNLITLGIGVNQVSLAGTDTVLAGPGAAMVYGVKSMSDVVLFGSGNNVYSGVFIGGSSATVVSATGNDQVNGGLGGSIVYFAGSGNDQFHAGGTVVGGGGNLSVSPINNIQASPVAGTLVFGGTGVTSSNFSIGAETIVGNAAGTTNVTQSGGSLMVFAEGTTRIDSSNGVETVIGINGALTVTGSSTALMLGAPGGNNFLQGGGSSTIFGAAGGDVLSLAPGFFTSQSTLVGGSGAETLSGAGNMGTNTFFAGSGPEFIQAGDWTTTVLTGTGAATLAGSAQGIALYGFVQGQHPDVVVQGFDVARHYLTLINFGTGEVATALAGATVSSGSEHVTLSDGTQITFQGVSGLTAGSFL